eukprot:XP_011664256.1 PREDICTED: myosin light chain kinase, smooth muscle isoform X2 [Strongylocentrotus purpuratus]
MSCKGAAPEKSGLQKARAKPTRQLSLKSPEETCPPIFQRHIGDKRVKEGECFSLECAVLGHPKPAVKWFHNGLRITESIGERDIQTRGKKHTLTIPSALPEDKGLYIVRAVNTGGVVHCGADVIVEEKSPEEIETEETEIPEEESATNKGDIVITPTGQSSNKTMAATKSDKMQPPWAKNNSKPAVPTPVKKPERHKIRHGDSGVYSMEMDDDVPIGEGKQKEESKMKEKKPAPKVNTSPASFLSQVRDVMIKEGNEVRFACHISGEPKPTVKWFHNSKRIHSTHDPRIVEDGFTTTLTIFSAQLTDLGEYSCEIYNGNGEKQTSSAKLTVQPERKKSSGRPPEFIDFFKDLSVCEGQDVNLVCKVRGTPTPKVIWLYNHRPIHESGDFKFYHESFSHRLHIVEVLPEDEGVYSCKAINSLGEKQISAELFVEEQTQGVESNKGPHTSARPSFLIHVEDAKCWEGKGVTFDCKLTGLPEPEIQWYHDGKEIEASNQGHYIIDRGNNGNCMLIIPHATVSDAGEYACVAKSTIGTAHSIAELVVIEGNEAQTSVHRGNKGKEGKYIEQFGISPTHGGWIGSKPRISDIHQTGITLTWGAAPVKKSRTQLNYILEAKDTYSKQWTLIATDILDTKFCVEEMDQKGAYMFRVRAESESGISEPGEESDLIKLKDVGNQPLFVKTTEEVFAVKDGKATLSCTLSGDPKPKVVWMREEEILKNSDNLKVSSQANGVCSLDIVKVTSSEIGEYRV